MDVKLPITTNVPGAIIGYSKSGKPIRLLAGAARDSFENWIPEEKGSKAIVMFAQKSAVDALGRHEPMAGDTLDVPRDGGFTVGTIPKGSAYLESTSNNDYVRLIAEKIGGAARVAVEDTNDSTVDPIATKRLAAARAMALFFDNATLGVTAAVNNTTVPYTSVYKTLRTTQSGIPGGDYTADTNYVATAGALTTGDLLAQMALLEDSDWVNEDELVWIGHPSFKSLLRGLMDDNNRPLWFDNLAQGIPDTLLGRPVKWTKGAKTHATANQKPTGNPLLFVGDPQSLIVGDAKLPGLGGAGVMGTQLQMAGSGVGFLTDEDIMKSAMRKGFAVAHPTAFAVIEKTS